MHSIVTGVTAGQTINVDKVKEVGEFILKCTNALDISFKCKVEAVTLATEKGVVIDGKIVKIDPQFLVQRLVSVTDKFKNTSELFNYARCSHPSSLFESSSLPRETKKAELANPMWKELAKHFLKENSNMLYIYMEVLYFRTYQGKVDRLIVLLLTRV